MRQVSSRWSSKTLLKHSIGFISLLSAGVLLALTGCNPNANNTAASNRTAEDSAQVRSNPIETSVSPGSTTGTVDSPSDMTVDPDSTNILDNALVSKGAQDNLFEIQAGQLAAQKATNSEIKQFAQRMVRDHTHAKDALQQLATERNITLPTEMGDQNQAIFARLSKLSGAEFDHAYMTEMVNSHQQDVTLMKNQVQNGKDQTLKALATQKLPALEAHLRMAQDLAQRLRG